MTEEQNTEALKRARTFSDNKDKIDGFYNGYVQATIELQKQIDKMKYALNKIIKTVQNDNISGYGDRLVIIYDISCEVLQEIKEK